jgi:hypothetical protein
MAPVCFDVEHIYYLTQYLPVDRVLRERGIETHFLGHTNPGAQAINHAVAAREGIGIEWVESVEAAVEFYNACNPSWIIFGNGCDFLSRLPATCRTAQLYHGIGMKSDVYKAGIMNMDVRFMEGPFYTREVARLYPDRKLFEVGYAKLDPLLGKDRLDRDDKLRDWGLDPGKSTLLYAPTFYPSSIGCMPDDWPRQLGDYNLIVKPHQFTMSKSRYRDQRRKLAGWSEFQNVHLAPMDAVIPIPYMAVADLLISEASSMLFEFAALDKPVIWCDFLKLRWTYRGPFRYRLEKRLDSRIKRFGDICPHAADYVQLDELIKQQLENPAEFSLQRRQYSEEIVGPTDGKTSQRIVDYLLENQGQIRLPTHDPGS